MLSSRVCTFRLIVSWFSYLKGRMEGGYMADFGALLEPE